MVKMNNLLFYIIIIALILGCVSMVYNTKKKENEQFKKAIWILYRQVARWSIAALQDESEMIALLHANYAAGYLWSIKDIVSTEEFKKITGVDFMEFENKVVEIQDTVTKRMIEKCPDLIFLKDKILLAAMYSRDHN